MSVPEKICGSIQSKEMLCLDESYSTTRCVTRMPQPGPEEFRGKLARSELLPAHEGTKSEGGLRTRGYFKACKPFDQEDGVDGVVAKRLPHITIITVVFNAANTLEQTILSVLNQSYGNVEYILVDGGSTDASVDIIRKYEHAIDYWVSEPDKGIYDAWNKGILLSTGEWIAFLGADDVYLEGAILAYATAVADNKNIKPEYISSRVNLTSGAKVLRTIGQRWNWNDFRKYMNVSHVGSLHSRELFEKYGLYDETYKICGDYELLLRPQSMLRATYLDRVTVNMSIGGVSDGNSRVFRETARAKIASGGRNFFMSHFERILGLGRWKLRSWLWY